MSGLPLRRGDVVGVDGALSLVGGLATAFLSDADGCADFFWGGGVAVVVGPRPFLSGEVAVGVTSLAVVGAASPADLAEVDTVEVTSLADARAACLDDAGMAFPADIAGVVTVGVASLADAGMAFPADIAGVVTVGVASLADAGMITVGVSDLADAGAVSLAAPLILLMIQSIVVVLLFMVIGCCPESGVERGLRFSPGTAFGMLPGLCGTSFPEPGDMLDVHDVWSVHDAGPRGPSPGSGNSSDPPVSVSVVDYELGPPRPGPPEPELGDKLRLPDFF